ncbi:MAG: phosphoribosylanthranilate isomerase, partial [Bdellovibrionales bacterium]|nr:phosphoribosylanthranilate isomerase [Oligoflexia bacterium]
MTIPLVKICGITRVEDAVLSMELGASAIGFIFYEKSPRFVKPARAQEIVTALGASKASLMKVGVFVNPTFDQLSDVLGLVTLTHLQLHGNESPEFCNDVKKLFPFVKLIKALRLNTPEAQLAYPVDFELLDHQSAQFWGGTGQTVSWTDACARKEQHRQTKLPFFLAGGLNADNIGQAILEVSPDGLDVSSGVEDSPG